MTFVSLAMASRWLPVRLAWRELRGGLRGFYVFIACIALGVMAIAGVSSVAASLAEGLAREGRTILGGDLSFNLSLREANADERAFLATRGDLSVAATMRAMARTEDGRTALVEMKAVDAAYPLFGTVALSPGQPLSQALASHDGVFGAVADPTLLARLDLNPPARVTVGAAMIEIRAALTSEPDKLGGGLGFGPRLLLSDDALRATELLQPGGLVRWHYRLRLPANDATDAAVRAVLRHAAVFAMPSRGEGFGLVYLQAMRAGIPCLGSRDDAAADVIVDGDTGLLVPHQDPEAIAGALARLLTDEAMRRRMGDAGRRRFESTFTYPRFRARLAGVLSRAFPAGTGGR